MSDDFDDLERRLREAHSFTPRVGLRQEIRAQLRPGSRRLPWAGLSAAAAVLVAVVGVGLLLHSGVHPGGMGAGTSGAASRFGAKAPVPGAATADFGPVPIPAAAASKSSAQGASPAQSVNPGAAYISPSTALVYRWSGGRLESSYYGVLPQPSGAKLLYEAVQAAQVLYFEPVYVLADGTVESALTPNELQPG